MKHFVASIFVAFVIIGSASAFFSGGGGGGGMSLSMGGGLSSLFGGKGGNDAGYVRTKAFIQESPELGLGFQKIPISIPMPTIILRKTKRLVTKGMSMPICGGGCGGGGGHGGGYGGGMGGGGGYGGGGYGGGMGGGGGY